MAVNGKGKIKALRAKGDHRVPFTRLGWEDARLGLPFRYDIPGATFAQQAAYENGRMRVLFLRQHGIAVPAWNAETVIPPKIAPLMKRIVDAHADAIMSGGVSWFSHGEKYWQPAA